MTSFEDVHKDILRILRKTALNNISVLCHELMGDSQDGIDDFIELNDNVNATWRQYFDTKVGSMAYKQVEHSISSILTYIRDIHDNGCRKVVDQLYATEHEREGYV